MLRQAASNHRIYRKVPAAIMTMLVAVCISTFPASAQSAGTQKIPRAEQLDKGIQYIRDPVTGELHTVPKRSGASNSTTPGVTTGGSVIRSQVKLIEIGCSAISANGDPLRNLTLEDFHLAADGEPQNIEHLDTSTEPAHLALVLDASPSEFHSLDDMKAAARALASELSPRDEVAVVAFAGHPHLLLPFTTDRKQLETSLDHIHLLRATEETGSNIYGAVYSAAQSFSLARTRRQAARQSSCLRMARTAHWGSIGIRPACFRRRAPQPIG